LEGTVHQWLEMIPKKSLYSNGAIIRQRILQSRLQLKMVIPAYHATEVPPRWHRYITQMIRQRDMLKIVHHKGIHPLTRKLGNPLDMASKECRIGKKVQIFSILKHFQMFAL
jgi:hypothetical protein